MQVHVDEYIVTIWSFIKNHKVQKILRHLKNVRNFIFGEKSISDEILTKNAKFSAKSKFQKYNSVKIKKFWSRIAQYRNVFGQFQTKSSYFLTEFIYLKKNSIFDEISIFDQNPMFLTKFRWFRKY